MARRPNDYLQEKLTLDLEHAQETASASYVLAFTPARKFRVRRVMYVNPTGLAADAANYFNLQLRKDATDVVANWSTETGQEGALTGDAPVEFTLSATDADLVCDAGTVLDLNLALTGTQTLPAGRLTIEGDYVE